MTLGKLFIWSARETALPMLLEMALMAFCVTCAAAPTIAPTLSSPLEKPCPASDPSFVPTWSPTPEICLLSFPVIPSMLGTTLIQASMMVTPAIVPHKPPSPEV